MPMNTNANQFGALGVGDRFPELAIRLSARANERYWAGAGVDHAARTTGVLYPPMAANLTILLVQQVSPEALLHAEQALACVASATGDAQLRVNGTVAERFEKRGREYAVIEQDSYLERIAKYVPAEVLAFSIFINAILDQALRSGGHGAMMGGMSIRAVDQSGGAELFGDREALVVQVDHEDRRR